MTVTNKKEELLLVLRDLKARMAEAGETLELTQAELCELMVMDEEPSISFKHDGVKIQGTVILGTRIKIREAQLKKALGAKGWARITSLTLDKKKLEDAIARGDIDPNVVAQYSDELPNKPYIKITEGKA
jgi:hypothetical protein